MATPAAASDSRTVLAMNSEPLSLRNARGSPCARISSARIRTTVFAPMLRPTSMCRHWRVYSSITTRNFRVRPSRVASKVKSYVHTSFGAFARFTCHAFSLVPPCARRAFGRATLSPACLQSRRTRFTFTATPSLRSIPQIIR